MIGPLGAECFVVMHIEVHFMFKICGKYVSETLSSGIHLYLVTDHVSL